MYEHLLLLLVAAVAAAAHEPQFYYRWLSPQLRGRQGYNPGYTPEFGSCGSGTTCADACGAAFQACNASTSLSLFCYDPAAGQTCCGNGSGRACEEGYYCALTDFDGQAYCCENGQTLRDCGVPEGPSSGTSVSTATATTTLPAGIVTTTVTTTLFTGGGSGGPAATVTTTVTVTVDLATTTVPGSATTIFSTVTESGSCTGSSGSPTPTTTSTSTTSATSGSSTTSGSVNTPGTSCYEVASDGLTVTRTGCVPSTTTASASSIVTAGAASDRRPLRRALWAAAPIAAALVRL